MTCNKSFLFCLFVLISICVAQRRTQEYQVPVPKVEALYPKGFRVTLKDDGYSFFGFRGNINKEFKVINEGEIKQDVIKPKNGKWVYKNRDVELLLGDTIFYWIYVLKNGKGYMNTDLEYTVTGFVNEDGTLTTSAQIEPVPSVPSQPETETPDSKVLIDPTFMPLRPTCTLSKTIVQGLLSVCTGSLVFNEEFDNNNLRDLVQWDAEIKFPREPDYPFNIYIPDNTVTFEGGAFVITPILTESQHEEGYLYRTLDLNVRCTGRVDTGECRQDSSGAQILPPVTTAKINTRRSFNFKFGKVEVRAKLPSGNWLMSEINLESSYDAYGSNNYESGLMRVAFTRGNPSLAKKLYGGPVLSDTEPFRSLLLKEKIGIDNWHKDFHNYTMIWKPDGIELFVDGERYGDVSPGAGFFESAQAHDVAHASHWLKGTVMAPLDQMFHITLGLRVGGINDFSDDLSDKPWRNSATKAMIDFWKSKDSWHPSWYNGALKIDYVRVYAL